MGRLYNINFLNINIQKALLLALWREKEIKNEQRKDYRSIACREKAIKK